MQNGDKWCKECNWDSGKLCTGVTYIGPIGLVSFKCMFIDLLSVCNCQANCSWPPINKITYF